MALSLASLRQTERRILFDQASPTVSRWADEDLNRFNNEALLEVSRVARRRKKVDLSFLAGEDNKSLPADLLSLDGLPLWKDATRDERVEVLRGETSYPLADKSGIPAEYWLLDSNIYLRPIPAGAGTLTLVYFRKFPDLVNDTDVPEPANVDGILIAYSLWQMLDFDGSPLATVWRDKFTAQIVAWSQEEGRKYGSRPVHVRMIR